MAAALAVLVTSSTLSACSKSSDSSPDAVFGSLAPTLDTSKDGKGVTDTEIKIVFNAKLKACGSDPATAATNVMSDQAKDELATLVKWFNENGKFPGGRQLTYQLVDDGGGGPGCEATARAGGLDAANNIQAFAALGASAADFAGAVTANGTVSIAPTGYQLNQDFTDRWPYAFGVYGTAQPSLQQLVGYINTRIKGTDYKTNDGAEQARKWGAIFTDTPTDHALANIVIADLKTNGIDAKAYFVSSDPTTLGTEAPSLAVQLKSNGINSLVFAPNGVGVPVAKAFTDQNFFPDLFVSDYGAYVALAILNDTWYGAQAKRFQGVGMPILTNARGDIPADGTPGKNSVVIGNQDATLVAYHQAGGAATTLTAARSGPSSSDMWAELSTLALGIQAAGDTLNAATFANGLTSYKVGSCQIERYFGQPLNDQTLSVYWTKDQPWGYHGFTTYYWQSTEKNVYGTQGFFESYDGYKNFDSIAELPKTPSEDTATLGGDVMHPLSTAAALKPDATC